MKIFLALALFLSNFAFASDGTWKWADFEIVGSRTASREEIIKAIPLKLGTEFKLDQAEWAKWCEALRVKFDFAYANCSAVRFIDFKAYLEVNIVEKGEEYRLKYRPAPTGDIAIKDPQIFALFDRLMERLQALFADGISVGEQTEGDYLDFTDPQMHAIVLELVAKAPASRANLWDLIRGHRDSKVRASAAWLLCWALKPEESIEAVASHIDDPDLGVRNDISRFMIHWVSRAKPSKKLIDTLVLQMKRPSHADRNKSLSNLVPYLAAHPELKPYLKSVGGKEIDHIATWSVLSNVGALAKQLQ